MSSLKNYRSKRHFYLSDRSVLTNRTMEEIASGAKPTLEGSTKATMPHHVKPMLCTLAPDAFNDAEWLFEIKWDGSRGIAEVKEGKVDLYSRNNHALKDRFPTIVQALQKVEATAIFDGEIVVLDKAGKSRFQLLQNYQKNQDGVPVHYIFDLLYLDEHDLRGLPLITRKNFLRDLLQKNPQEILRFSDHIVQDGKGLFKATAKNGLEGIIAKHSQSHYEHRRSREWLKIKATQVQEAIICGFTALQKSRKYLQTS